MRSETALGLAIAVLIALVATHESVAASVVSGRVVNATTGASLPTSLVVTAVGLSDNGSEVGRSQSNTAGDGTFSIDAPSGTKLVIATDYLGVTYSTVVNSLESPVELRIFEVSSNDSAISVASDTITLVGGESTLEILQLMKVVNSSDRTYVGEQIEGVAAVLKLPIADGAFDLAPGQGVTPRNLQPMAGGFQANDPILPGTTEINYIYKVKVGRSGLPLRRAIFYPTDHVDVLIGPGLEVTGNRLSFQESVNLAGKGYRRYRGGPFRPGAQLDATVSFASDANSTWLTVGLIAGGTIIVAAAFFIPFYSRRRRRQPGPNRQALIEEIATLDESFASGVVGAQEYQDARNRLKTKLQEMSSNSSGS